MEWQAIVAMVVAVPIMLLPVAFVWYLTLGGMRGWVKEKGRTTEKATGKATAR